MGMGTAASRRSEADHIAAIEDSFLSLAALPAPAPADQLISQQSLSSDTPVGMEQYLQRVVEATRYRGRMKWAGAREAAPSPALQSEEAPEVTRTAVLDFTESSDENETSIGSGTLNFFARNGSLLSQMPYSAPLVARSTLERALLLMKLTAAGAASTEFVNRTLPTVKTSRVSLPASFAGVYLAISLGGAGVRHTLDPAALPASPEGVHVLRLLFGE